MDCYIFGQQHGAETHLAKVAPAEGRGGKGGYNKGQASSSLVISREAERPLLPNWHRLPPSSGSVSAGETEQRQQALL